MEAEAYTVKSPVALIIFNRPDTASAVFERIRQARPTRLYLIADGPRADRVGEAELVARTRALVDCVDWDCEVKTNFFESNFGCRVRIPSGLDWLFKHESEAIILEDDCLPHPTFFRFCDEMLDRYRENEEIMLVAGTNLHFGCRRGEGSYFFSRYPSIWGWATWRRVWQRYDVRLNSWPRLRQSGWLRELMPDEQAFKYWQNMFDVVYETELDSFAFQLNYLFWRENGLSIIPNVNLVSNIGCRADAAHTKTVSFVSDIPARAMSFPLVHPPEITTDRQGDRYIQYRFYTPTFKFRVVNKLARIRKNLHNRLLKPSR